MDFGNIIDPVVRELALYVCRFRQVIGYVARLCMLELTLYLDKRLVVRQIIIE